MPPQRRADVRCRVVTRPQHGAGTAAPAGAPRNTRSPPYPTPARYSPCAGAVRPAADRGRPASSSTKSATDRRPPADLEHRPHQHPVHLAHERVGLDPELQHVGAGPARQYAANTSRENRW